MNLNPTQRGGIGQFLKKTMRLTSDFKWDFIQESIFIHFIIYI